MGSRPYFHQGDVTIRFWSARVQVQVLSGAPSEGNPNLLPVGDGFGFFCACPNFISKILKI